MDLNKLKFSGKVKTHHGVTKAGTQVDSARSQVSDDGSALKIWRGPDQIGYIISTDEFELLASQFLADRGYTVTSA